MWLGAQQWQVPQEEPAGPCSIWASLNLAAWHLCLCHGAVPAEQHSQAQCLEQLHEAQGQQPGHCNTEAAPWSPWVWPCWGWFPAFNALAPAPGLCSCSACCGQVRCSAGGALRQWWSYWMARCRLVQVPWGPAGSSQWACCCCCSWLCLALLLLTAAGLTARQSERGGYTGCFALGHGLKSAKWNSVKLEVPR